MVVANSSQLNECRNSFLSAVGKAVLLTSERTSSHENVAERINDLKVESVHATIGKGLPSHKNIAERTNDLTESVHATVGKGLPSHENIARLHATVGTGLPSHENIAERIEGR
jgi:trehalose utilization protein